MKTAGSMREAIEFRSPDPGQRDENLQIDVRNIDHYFSAGFARFAAITTGSGKVIDKDQVEGEITHTVEVWADEEVETVRINWIIVWSSLAGEKILHIIGPPQRIRVNPPAYAIPCLEVTG